MSLLPRSFLPDVYAASVAEMNLAAFKHATLVVFDVDNTLVLPETVEVLDATRERVQKISEQKRCVLVSNSRSVKKRTEALQNIFGCKVFTGFGRKPSKRLFQRLCADYNVLAKEVVVVGDRLWSDVWFAKRNGAKAILVAPLTSHEAWYIKLARHFEALLLSL